MQLSYSNLLQLEQNHSHILNATPPALAVRKLDFKLLS